MASPDEMPAPIEIAPANLRLPKESRDAREEASKPKRYSILIRDLEQFGYSNNCAACEAARSGRSRLGINHSEACRCRIEKAVQETESSTSKARLTAGKEREEEYLAKELEKKRKKEE